VTHTDYSKIARGPRVNTFNATEVKWEEDRAKGKHIVSSDLRPKVNTFHTEDTLPPETEEKV